MGSFGEVTEFGHGFKSQFLFDPKYTNLNHGMLFYLLPAYSAERAWDIPGCQPVPEMYHGVKSLSGLISLSRIIWDLLSTRTECPAWLSEACRSGTRQVLALSIRRSTGQIEGAHSSIDQCSGG